MRRALLLGLIAATALRAHASMAAGTDDPFRNTDCSKAAVQMEMDYCANRAFAEADRKLNLLYRKLLASSDAKDRELLKTAERNWIAFRDSECAYETAGSEGGSIHPMEYSNCLRDKTDAHIKELVAQGP